MEPMDIPSLPLLGFDALSFPLIRSAVEESIQTGKARATKPYNLHTGGTGYVIISPVYTADNLPENKIQRYDLATRLVAVAISTDNILNSIEINDNESLTYSYFDEESKSYTITRTINTEAIDDKSFFPVYTNSHTLNVAGQNYALTLKRQLSWADLDYEWIAFAITTTAAFSLLLFNFVHLRIQSVRASQRAQAEIFQEREHAQVTLHSISEAVITTDIDRHIIYMNPIARRITGWNEEEAIGMPIDTVFRLLHEQNRTPIKSTVDECLVQPGNGSV